MKIDIATETFRIVENFILCSLFLAGISIGPYGDQ